VKEEIIRNIQDAAATKTAGIVAIAGATSSNWVDLIVQSKEFQAVGILLGLTVSVTIIILNIQAIKYRSHKNSREREMDELRLRSLRKQLGDTPKD